MGSTLLVLLTPCDGYDPTELVAAVQKLDGAVVMTREPDPLSNGPTVPTASSTDFAIAAALGIDRAAELARIRMQIDPARSAVLAGTDHEIMPTPPIATEAMRIYCMRRLPQLTLEQFHRYWLDTHADFGRRALAGRGYRQLHADPILSQTIAADLGITTCDIDGAVLSATPSWASYDADRADPEKRAAGAAALKDELNFIDHSRSMAMRYTLVRPGL